MKAQQRSTVVNCGSVYTAQFSRDRCAFLLACLANLTAAIFRGGAIDSLAVIAKDHAVDRFGDLTAHPAVAEVFQNGAWSAIKGIAKSTAAGDIIDQQTALRQRHSLRHA